MELAEIDFKKASQIFDYQEYKKMVELLLGKGQVTGDFQSESLLETTKMNLHRMNRIDKNSSLQQNVLDALQKVKKDWTWYLITEGWCGDGSQNIPIISHIAENSTFINYQIILRDENPEIMDMYLTNGGRAVPKLIAVDNVTGAELGLWGPRPRQIQHMVTSFKKENPEAGKTEFAKNLHKWYARDKGKALQDEFAELINEWAEKQEK